MFNIDDINKEDELRVDKPYIPYFPDSHDWPKLPHKYGLDDPQGKWQFQFLLSEGVDENRRFLEIGPGGFRLAQHLIPYLRSGNYYAVEVSKQGLDWGWNLLEPESRGKNPKLFWGGDFQFSVLDFQPEVVWAHSVFTHLNWNHIGQCLDGLRQVVGENCRFYATYFRCTGNQWNSQPYGPSKKKKLSGKHLTYGYKDPYHYRYEFMENLARDTGWEVTHRDLPEHNKGQSLLLFEART